MHPTRHPRYPTVLLAALLILLGVLATRQITATLDLVESRRSLQEQAVATALTGIQIEVGTMFEDLMRAFEPEPTRPLAARLSESLSAYRSGQNKPDLIDAVWVVAPGEPKPRIRRLDADAGILLLSPSRPGGLDGVLQRIGAEIDGIERSPEGGTSLVQHAPYALFPAPSVAFPLFQPGIASGSMDIQYVVVTLRPDVLFNDWLPQVLAAHTKALADVFLFRIRSPDGSMILEHGTAPSAVSTEADFMRSLVEPISRIYEVTPDGQISLTTERRKGIDTDAPTSTAPASPVGTIEAVHRAGSMALAASRTVRRQLGLSAAILVLVIVTVFVLVVTAQRARRLGEQQLSFVAGVSHELRTPVAAIGALADNMESGVVRDETHAREYGDLIQKERRRLHAMVEQSLAIAASYSDLEQDRIAVDLAALIERVLAALDIPDRIRVQIEIRSNPAVTVDPDALEMALRNVLVNAVKHGSENGTILIEMDTAMPTGRAELRIRISDDGPGIPQAERSRVLDPFFRGTRARDAQIPGSGLGLNLVQRVVWSHGGRVAVESARGGGTCITIHLPVSGTRS